MHGTLELLSTASMAYNSLNSETAGQLQIAYKHAYSDERERELSCWAVEMSCCAQYLGFAGSVAYSYIESVDNVHNIRGERIR